VPLLFGHVNRMPSLPWSCDHHFFATVNVPHLFVTLINSIHSVDLASMITFDHISAASQLALALLQNFVIDSVSFHLPQFPETVNRDAFISTFSCCSYT